MGTPEQYDWGLSPETIAGVRAGFTVSVGLEFEITPERVEAIALLSGLPLHEISQDFDTHIERGTE